MLDEDVEIELNNNKQQDQEDNAIGIKQNISDNKQDIYNTLLERMSEVTDDLQFVLFDDSDDNKGRLLTNDYKNTVLWHARDCFDFYILLNNLLNDINHVFDQYIEETCMPSFKSLVDLLQDRKRGDKDFFLMSKHKLVYEYELFIKCCVKFLKDYIVAQRAKKNIEVKTHKDEQNIVLSMIENIYDCNGLFKHVPDACQVFNYCYHYKMQETYNETIGSILNIHLAKERFRIYWENFSNEVMTRMWCPSNDQEKKKLEFSIAVDMNNAGVSTIKTDKRSDPESKVRKRLAKGSAQNQKIKFIL